MRTIKWIQTEVKGQGSLELTLEKKKIEIWPFFTQLVQTCMMGFMNVLGLERYSAQDHEYES